MEPNKFDNEFRDKLNKREIQPSANAWDRLDAMLAVAEQKKPVRSFGWLYIAASFLGFLLIATLFYNQEDPVENPGEEVVVEHQNTKPSVGNSPVVVTHPGQIASNPISSGKPEEKKSHPQQFTKITNNTHLANVSVINQNQSIINQTSEGERLDQAQPSQILSTNTTDELLAAAQLATGVRSPAPAPVKVNAKSLLSQVDGELNLSFRDRVLYKVGKNYQNVKVALANRNLEEENH